MTVRIGTQVDARREAASSRADVSDGAVACAAQR
jgi:hypothetical protein